MRTKFEMEFPLNTSVDKLYEYISKDYRLAQWFAKKVTAQENDQIFRWEWEDITVHSQLEQKIKNKFVRFRIIENKHHNEYFELKIEKNQITDDVALIITDFADKNEVEDFKLLWKAQAKDLALLIENE